MSPSLSSEVRAGEPLASSSLPTRGAAHTDTRISGAFFLLGFASFSLIYCVQPLFGDFTRDFAVNPTQTPLALSLTTGLLAVAILLMSALSERFRAREVMFVSMTGAALLTLGAALSPSWPLLLLARAAEGAVLGGVPAIAMVTLSRLIDPSRVGRAMGIYVGGTAFGGMMGRVAVGALTEFTSWRLALATLAGLALLAAVGFRWLLPATPPLRRGDAAPITHHLQVWWRHLTHARLFPLFTLGFLNLGVFVAVLNFVGFRLTAAPYHLSQTQLSLLFTVYLFGVVSSPVSGSLADRYGRPRVLLAGLTISILGLLLTLASPLPTLLLGLVLMTTGFFITHSVASSWVGQAAPDHKGHASALYLLAYYLGSSIVGYAAGNFWTAGHWAGVVAFTAALLLLALGLAWRQAAPPNSNPLLAPRLKGHG